MIDTQESLAHWLLTADKTPPRVVCVSGTYICKLREGPYTDSYGLVWEMVGDDILKCNGAVWKIDHAKPFYSNGEIFYPASWPD